jgi:hypothetical protein
MLRALLWFLCGAFALCVVLWVVHLLIGMMDLPPPIAQLAITIIGLIGLVVLLILCVRVFNNPGPPGTPGSPGNLI